jgi:hypothetical protein
MTICSPTAYVGCTPTTIVTHAPTVVGHLAFTGAGTALVLIADAGFACILVGFIVWVRR